MSTPTTRRVTAVLALVAHVAVVVAAIVVLIDDFVALLLVLAGLTVVAVAAWLAVTHVGIARVLSLVGLAAGTLFTIVALVADATIVDLLVLLALGALAAALSRAALSLDRSSLRADVPGRPSARPQRPVLLMNPRSGGGKVAKFDLEQEARRRGVEAVVLRPGDDLDALAREAVARGADVLGMAGGDGSQALVASIACDHGLPFVCIPAGTRNHFALDLGIDRDDVVGALDAFVHGYEHTIDLARVNGHVFVNNCSLGVYAEIVQSDQYRDAKLKTAVDMLPRLLGPDAERFSFEVDTPSGEPLRDACLVLVSNNVYELDRLGGFGTRARIDGGVLGVVAVQVDGPIEVAELVTWEEAGHITSYRGWHQWETQTLEIRSDGQVAAGVDGESLQLDTPLRLEVLPHALRVRLPRRALDESPAAVAHATRTAGFRGLLRVAFGRSPKREKRATPAPQ